GVNAEETSGVKAPLFNLSNYQNTELFKKYVRSTKDGKLWNNSLTMSAGPLFVVTGRDNSCYRYSYGFNEKEETMSMLWNTRFLRQNDGRKWKTTFKFKMNSDSYSEYGEFMKMLDAGQIKMRFGGNFHNYGGGRPSMKFMGKGIDGSDLPDDASVEKDSGWFSVSKNDLLYNEIVMSGSGSGTNSAINHPFVQFADLTKPSIKNVSVSRGTLYLDMGEPLKKIGDLSNMKLNLILSNPETGIQSEKRTAVATYINGNKIAFSIDDEGLDEYQVTKIESFECGGEYQSELMGVSLADNYLFSTYYHEAVYKHVDNAPGGMGEYTKSSTPAVDLAGNNVEITAKDLTPYKLVVDRIKPVVAAAEISGSMITNDSTKYSQASDWPEDIDRSSVFAGIGDTLTFSVITSEEVEVNERNGKISVDLNINDENGKPISLDYDKLENMYDGVNKRPATRITFKPLTIMDEMSAANKNESIRPIKINASWLFDYYGNAFDSTELSVVPRQQLYFDNELPTVKIDTITGDVNSGDFCVPLTISDGEADRITSGTIGLSADFAWVYDGDAQHEYKYAITTSAQTPADSEFKTSVLGNKNSPSWNKFDLPVNEYYLHIKTDADEIKNTELKFMLNDWAGNSAERSAEIPQISIDRTAPQIELVSINTTYTNATEGSSAKVKADIAISDFNIEGLRAQYIIADSKDADSIADLNEASVSADGKFSVEMTYSETVDKVLVVTATDAKGNNSETAKFPFSVDLTKASANYTINSDLSKLNQKPDIRVSAPNNPNAREYAQTRVVLKMGDNYYVRVYDTDEQKNIFDFDGDWYRVKYNDDKSRFDEVDKIEDTSELSNYYGVVNVSFDSAFGPLSPIGGEVKPVDSEQAVTYRSEGGFDVMYAPLTENLHNVTFADKFTSNGSDLEPNVKSGSSKHITKQTSMSDVRLKFNISNSRMNEWGIKNLDLDKSYISVTTLGGTEVYRTKLSRNSEQTFSMPDWDMNGDKLKTDAYYVTVYLYQVGSDTPQKFGYDTAVVLDDTTPSTDTGIKKYYILPNVNFKNISLEASIPEISKESETPFNVINLGAAKWQETERSEEEGYAKTTDGFFIFKLTLSTKNVSKNILGERIGEIEGFRLWNKACTGGENLEFKSGKAVSEELYSKEFEIRSVEKISDSLSGTAASGDLQLAKGLNTLCYQVKLANGNISPVYEMTINVTDNAPQIALDMKINESQNYSDENSIHALSVDASVVNAFSPNGDVKLYYINKGKDANNLAARFDEIKLGDTVNFTADSRQNYQTYTEKDNSDTKNANYAFLALDDSGNSAIIYPQFKDDTNYMFEHETLNFTRFSLDSSNYSFYRYVLDGANVDLSKSTLIINDGEEIPLIGSELPNEYGYDGAMISDDGKLKLDFAKPWNADKEGENFITKLTVNRVGIHGDKRTETYEVNPTDPTTGLSPISYSKPEYRMWDDNYNRGTRIDFNSFVKIKGDDDYTVGNPRYYPIFSDGTYNIEVTDAFGVDYTIPVDVNVWGSGPQVDVSPIYKTRDKVTVNVAYENNVTLTEKEGNSFAEITGSGTNSVTAVVSQPTDLIMKWTDSSGEHERTMYIGNNEIKPIDPEIKWDYSENDIVDGNCVYESVTATVIDKNGSTLKDAVTGEGLSHTFYPGGETEYTFSSYVNQHGDKGADITASLPVTVIEYPAPSEWKDTTAPSVQMLGYTVKNSVAEDKKLVLNLYDQDKELTNPALVNYGDGYTVTEDTSSFVDKMGFASQYRFNVYAADESAVKLIAKSGLVTDSPKFNEQGDSIDGVNVSGRAVDITKNVQFTLFAVDSYDNAKAIQFDIDSIGNIPEPVVEKVVSNDGRQVKVYLVSKDNDVTDIKMTDNS
ncbi:MAG: Ig-like domain-containing protein, partial [Clostridia bacterium]|nr:Ig-like domain-containing protein [Clostridia bacterium]